MEAAIVRERHRWGTAATVGVVVGVLAWISSARFALLDVRYSFSTSSAVGAELARELRVDVHGVPSAEVTLWPSCECARFEERDRENRGDGVSIRGVFLVDPQREEPGVRPGVWIAVRNLPFRLLRPEAQ